MARRSPQSVLKRAREQALREKRERKQAKKDARTAERRLGDEAPATQSELDPTTPDESASASGPDGSTS